MKRDVDFTDVPYTEVKPQPKSDTGDFMDGVITAVCLSILMWALILGVASWAYNLNL